VTGRLEAARRRAANLKRRVGVFAAAGFVALFGLAAASHGGTPSSSDDPSAVQQPATDDSSGFDFGTADVAPSDGLEPEVQTRTS
jgi:hypothetical protein